MRAASATHSGAALAGRRPGAAKYRAAYDGERRWLAENRGRRSAFTDVVTALLEQGPVSYRELTARVR